MSFQNPSANEQKPRRKKSMRFYSLLPLAISLYLLMDVTKWALFLIPLALMGVYWHFFGMLFIILSGIMVIYTGKTGFQDLAIIALAFLAVEMGQMDRERAPLEHYAVLLISVLLSFPTYALMRATVPFLPRLEVTAIAALLVLSAYAFTKMVGD